MGCLIVTRCRKTPLASVPAVSSLALLAAAAALPVPAALAQGTATPPTPPGVEGPAAAAEPAPAAEGRDAVQRPVDLTATASISEEFTDNVGGVGTTGRGNDDSDFITTLNVGVGVAVDSAHTKANAAYRLGYDHYLDNDDLSGFRHNLAGNGTFEAVEDHLFLDAATALTQRSVGLGQATATERTAASGQTGIWTFALGPTWRHHLGDFADASLGYRLSGSAFFETDVGDAGDSSRPSDSIGHELNAGLVSGEQFGRLRWDLATLFGNYYNEGELREERRTVDIGTEYRVSPELGILVSTGYDDIQFYETKGVSRLDAEEDDVNAPFLTAGLRFNPSPNLDAQFEVGRRYDDPYYTGSLGWDITSRTNLTASYTMDVVTQQQALIEAQCADPTDPFCLPLEEDLTNDSFRRKTLSVRFTHRYERTTYGLSGSWAVREFNGTGGGDDSTLQFLASVDHNLTPTTSGVLQIGYTLGDTATGTTRTTGVGGTGRTDEVDTLRGTVGLTQQLSEDLSGSLSYSHLRREDGTETSSENSIVARVSAEF